MKNESNKKYVRCPHCSEMIYVNIFCKHLSGKHGVSDEELTKERLYAKEIPRFQHIPEDIRRKFIDRLWTYNECKKLYNVQFSGTYDHTLAAFGKFDETDIEYFFSTVLPFKLSYPSQPNDKKLAAVEAHDDPEKTELIYKKFMFSKNPFVGHGAELSPFSKNFRGYKDMTDEEKEKRAWDAAQRDRDDKLPTQLKYWIAKGYDEDEAREMLAERQRTFTIEKCIERYGEEEGKRIYEDRQIRWQNTLNSKPPEEIERINRAKMNFGPQKRGYSLVSQELFWEIYKAVRNDFNDIRFATIDPETHERTETNNELHIHCGTHCYFLDFYIDDIKVDIEFDGDKWHGTKERMEKDLKRDTNLIKEGISVFHIKEGDYRKDKKNTVRRCLEFIYEHAKKTV